MSLKDQAMTMERRVDRKQRALGIDRLTATNLVIEEMEHLEKKGFQVHCVPDEDKKTARTEFWAMIDRANSDYMADVYLIKAEKDARVTKILIMLIFLVLVSAGVALGLLS